MRAIVGCLLVAACAEPAVELSFRAPAENELDTSCITAVEVRAIGARFAEDPTDYQRSCLALDRAAPTFAALRNEIRGRFELPIPASGLAGVVVRGWAGPSACERSDESLAEYRADFNANLVLHASAEYAGEDTIALDAIPNVKCPTTRVRVRVVDMLALVTAGSTASCGTAMAYPDRTGWSGIGTLVPKPFGQRGVDFFGNVSWAEGTNSLVQFDGMMQLVRPGERACLALAGATETAAATGCVVPGPSVCATAGELEVATVDFDLYNQVDRTLQGTFPGVVFGSVWGGGTPNTPLAGARVTVDPALGKVIYLDPPDASGKLAARSDQTQTGPSGLFVLYASTIVHAEIATRDRSRTVMLGAPGHAIGGALIALP